MEDKNGFTLVEVVVSIATGSLILGLILSLILTSFQLFSDTASDDRKKTTNDNVIEYISEVIHDATDVRIKTISNPSSSLTVPAKTANFPTTKLNDKENWHYMFINSSGRLVIDGKVMFGGNQTAAFYGSNGTKLLMSYKVNVDSNDKKNMSLDLTTILDNTSSHEAHTSKYSKTNTVSLNNIVTKTYQDRIADKPDEGKLINGKSGSIDRNNIIYFANEKVLTVQSVVEPTYTIADKLNLLSDSNRNRGQFQASYITAYEPGDIVVYNGFTYLRTSTSLKDRYTRTLNNNTIKPYSNSNFFTIEFGGKKFYVHKDYIETDHSWLLGTTYKYKFKTGGNGNKTITCVPVTTESTQFLNQHSDLTSDDPYFNVILNYLSGNNAAPQVIMMLAPDACVQLSSGYAYSGYERLATQSYMTAPSETPEPAEFDSNSTYLPGDLVVCNGYLFYIQQMSLGSTQNKGHVLADTNGNPISESGTYYGTGARGNNVVLARRIGKYEGDDTNPGVLDTMMTSPDSNNYSYWVPKNTDIESLFNNSRNSITNNPNIGKSLDLKYWWKDDNDNNGEFAIIPARS